MLEKKYRQIMSEQREQRERKARLVRGEPESERVYKYTAPPPSNATPRQKLDYANAFFDAGDGYKEPALTTDEMGMSKADFDRLPARRRNDIYSNAIFERRRKVAG